MDAKANAQYYSVRAQQELDMANTATDDNVKALHLDMAEQYASLRIIAEAETLGATDTTDN